MTRSRRGTWLVLGLFVLGGCALAGLFFARGKVSKLSTDAIRGVPERTLRFVSLDLSKIAAGEEMVARELGTAERDFILVQKLPSDQADELARRLKMNVAIRADPNLKSEGIAIFSKHVLGEPVAVQDRSGRLCAVFVDAVVDGRRFAVASVDLGTGGGEPWEMIRRKWKQWKDPPIVIGGDFEGAPADALVSEGFRGVGDQFFVSGPWLVGPGGADGAVELSGKLP